MSDATKNIVFCGRNQADDIEEVRMAVGLVAGVEFFLKGADPPNEVGAIFAPVEKMEAFALDLLQACWKTAPPTAHRRAALLALLQS